MYFRQRRLESDNFTRLSRLRREEIPRLESGNFTRPSRLRREEIAVQVATFVSTNSGKTVGTRSCARFVIRLVDLHGNPIRDQHGRIAVLQDIENGIPENKILRMGFPKTRY